MMKYLVIVCLVILNLQVFSQEESTPIFVGVQPSVTKEKFYDKGEFDLNVIPFVFEKGINKRMDLRITTLANYHFGDNARFSDIGFELASPIFLKKKESQYSNGFFASPIVGPSRNNLNKHYTLTLALEGGYLFDLGNRFALSTQIQYGSSCFNYDSKQNEWLPHFGVKVNFGYWF